MAYYSLQVARANILSIVFFIVYAYFVSVDRIYVHCIGNWNWAREQPVTIRSNHNVHMHYSTVLHVRHKPCMYHNFLKSSLIYKAFMCEQKRGHKGAHILLIYNSSCRFYSREFLMLFRPSWIELNECLVICMVHLLHNI